MLTDVQISAADLLPGNTHYLHFKGSLTTPPCSEGVNWYVLQENIEISKRQLAKFIGVIGNNARPVQSQNDRFVLANQ